MTIAGYYKCILLIALAGGMPLLATAQSLSTKQEVSLRAPDYIKIDGKTTEWGDQFQAYNSASRIFYTVSNDDKNLYLTAKMKDIQGNFKVLQGGITFTVNSPTGKGDKSAGTNNVSVTFPVIVYKTGMSKDDIENREVIQTNSSFTYRRYINAKPINNKKIDSLILVTNKRKNNFFKDIQVNGINEIKDPVISIYNTYGIQAGAMFNNHMEYTYELAIPLKYFGIAINNGEKFSYNVKLNAYPTIIEAGTGGPPKMGNFSTASPDVIYRSAPTDFSGEYTLAKK